MKFTPLAIVAVAGLAGCAAVQTPPGYRMETDYAQMQAIDHAARSRGVQVIWISAPQKVVKTAGG